MPTESTIHVSKFKAKAKQLQKAVALKDAEALSQIQPYFGDAKELKLTQAQLVVARTLNFSSWKQLVTKSDWLACSFCKKWQYELSKLVAGPDVYVCDECIGLCNEIIKNSEEAPKV